MDATQVLQIVLSAMQSGVPDVNATPAEGSPHVPTGQESPRTSTDEVLPSSLPRMVFMLLSMSAVRDWIKLFLMGAILEGSRRILALSWEKLVDYVWVTATFESNDEATGMPSPLWPTQRLRLTSFAEWLMYWLSRKKVFRTCSEKICEFRTV